MRADVTRVTSSLIGWYLTLPAIDRKRAIAGTCRCDYQVQWWHTVPSIVAARTIATLHATGQISAFMITHQIRRLACCGAAVWATPGSCKHSYHSGYAYGQWEKALHSNTFSNRPFATIPRIQFCASFWGWRESWSSTDAGKATWIIMAMHVFEACVHHRLNWVLSPYTYGFS